MRICSYFFYCPFIQCCIGSEEHDSCVDTSHLRPLVLILGSRKSFPLNICISPVVIVDVSDSSCYVLGWLELRRYKGFPVNKQRKRRTWGWHIKMKNVVRFVVKKHEADIWKWRSSFDFFERPSAQWETHNQLSGRKLHNTVLIQAGRYELTAQMNAFGLKCKKITK